MNHSKSGFSIVEIMVSMVILSIVMLVMSNVIIVSSLEHSAAQGKDDGEFVARQKLNELQNPSSTIPVGGTIDDYPYKGIHYKVVWTLSSTTPILATVEVEWTTDGRQRRCEVAGYLEASNACAEISPNTDPSLKLFTLASTPVEITNWIVPASHLTQANSSICRLKGIDPDTTNGDAVTLSLPSGADNAKFSISGDTLKTKVAFNTAGEPFQVKVQVLDCRNNVDGTYEKQFTVQVGAVNDKPKAPNPQNTFTVAENTAVQTGTQKVDSLKTDELFSGLEWSSTNSSPFTVELNGRIKVSTASLNFESTNKFYDFQAKLTNSQGKDSTIDVRVAVTDANDAPTDITLSNTVAVLTTTAGGTTIANLTATDQDAASSTTAWNTHVITLDSLNPFFIISANSIKVKNSVTLTAGDQELKIKAQDIGGTGLSVTKYKTITITAPTGSCGTPWDPNEHWSTYTVGVERVDANKKWSCKNPSWAQSYNPASAAGQQYGWDFLGDCP